MLNYTDLLDMAGAEQSKRFDQHRWWWVYTLFLYDMYSELRVWEKIINNSAEDRKQTEEFYNWTEIASPLNSRMCLILTCW